MHVDPYAPPLAPVADVVAPAAAGKPLFFPVSAFKLVLMSICTIGLYQYYWFYKNWQAVRQHDGEALSPALRTFFAVFFCHALFKRIRQRAATLPGQDFPAGPLALAWFVFTVTWRLPEPYWLLGFLAVFALLPVQACINAINRQEAPHHDPNSRFSGWNWVALVAGGLLILLALIGTFLPSQPSA